MMMKRLLCSLALVTLTYSLYAANIIVTNADELKKANKEAKPGDIIILKNGEWNNITMFFDAKGTGKQPITFKAEKAGQVRITGESRLRIGGEYLIIDGFYFTNGYAGKNSVIDFRTAKDKVANHCRVTNTVINDFNNPKRMDENYWVAFAGKNNRLDHCSFFNKTNIGVLLAVLLDDDNYRENFHSIDHNHFGHRPPLGSNGGEIIRVGVSQHCEFYSNTQITDNFFEECDGETEIVSIKSCGNVVRNNLFLRSQGSVVLRHGNYNTVENNLFLGYGKPGTGGVRIINKGQWVVNNYFYRCRGVDFRSPLSIMNGIPNSPAHRYVQVTDAVIANNSWDGCSPASFCEGSDAERTLPPDNVLLAYNIFRNQTDTAIYRVFDDIKGFRFVNNAVSPQTKQQQLATGFIKSSIGEQKYEFPFLVVDGKWKTAIPDSIQQLAKKRLGHTIREVPGFYNLALIKKIEGEARAKTGAAWYQRPVYNSANSKSLDAADASSLVAAIEAADNVTINLTGKTYNLSAPLMIRKRVVIKGDNTSTQFITPSIDALFVVEGNGELIIQGLNADGADCKAKSVIASSKDGQSAHYNLAIRNSGFKNFRRQNGCNSFFEAHKSMTADSIIIRNNAFDNNDFDIVLMNEEKDDKGYYNAEKIVISQNKIENNNGIILDIYRGGNDESTLGPQLEFSRNLLTNCQSAEHPLFSFTGVQVTNIFANRIVNSNPTEVLITYKDIVRARHLLESNSFEKSGSLQKNEFVTEKNNSSL